MHTQYLLCPLVVVVEVEVKKVQYILCFLCSKSRQLVSFHCKITLNPRKILQLDFSIALAFKKQLNTS